ncbi:MAG TPA: hypothetical protein VIF62_25065 [Labilithrix sp.]
MAARRFVRALLILALAFSCTAFGTSARANGRFPQAQVIESVPGGDGTLLYMRTTFGILVSHDAGKSWRWICERALGYQGQWDPPIAVTRDGTLWVGLDDGVVAVSRDCETARSPEMQGETIKDFTTDAQGETLWAITGRAGEKSALFRRAPAGKWEKLDAKGLEDLNLLTVDVAPSRSQRIYVSGEPYEDIRGRLYRSDDGGKTFTGGPNDLAAQGPFFIAAVDPKDPSRVLVRHLHTTGSDMLLTKDGGKTLTNVLSMKSAMFGFAKSPDGATYWAASGLAEHGIFESTDRGEHFVHVGAHGVLCLHAAAGDRLFVCENTWKLESPIVGLSVDRGKTVTTIAGFGDVVGPVACASDAGAAAICAGEWPAMRASLFPRVDAGARATGAEEPPPPKRSCSCDAAGAARDPDHAWLSAGLIPLVAWVRARKRAGSRRDHSGRDRSETDPPPSR